VKVEIGIGGIEIDGPVNAATAREYSPRRE